MVDMDFEWDGASAADLAKQIDQFESDLQSELVSACEDIAARVTATAKRLAPVDTGRLRASITADVERVASHTVKAIVGSNVEYAPIQEVQNPYLRPAFEQERGYIKSRIEDAVEAAVP